MNNKIKLIALSLIGIAINAMEQPYFTADNKTVLMRIPYGWEDNQLEQGESVRLCADFNNFKDGDIIAKNLKTSVEALEEEFIKIAQTYFSAILPNTNRSRLGGNVLRVKSADIYLATEWYKLVQYYYYGRKETSSLRLAGLVGAFNQKILVIPIELTHYSSHGEKLYETAIKEAWVCYFESKDGEKINDRNEYKRTDNL
jgi:hypothetical protein